MPENIEGVRAALAGAYAIDREIGRGAMATVYLARDQKHDRQVAVKVMRADLDLGVERFLREIEIAAQLNHPHILPLYDSGSADGLLYYVTPFVDGETLGERIARAGPLPTDEAARFTEQIALALAYAHEQGFVHRDVKPSNILISAGQAVVSDFGVAYAVSVAQGERLTAAGTTVGTLGYMSPEQVNGEETDGRSDIYSVGCLLFEMLTGHKVYRGTPASIAAQHVRAPIPSATASRPETPVVLEEAIRVALSKHPADRYAHAGDLAEAVRPATFGERSTAWLLAIPDPLRGVMRRKVIEWGLTYTAAAWLVVQVVEALANVWPLSLQLQRGIQLVLGLGLVATIGLTWVHNKRGGDRIRGPVLLGVALVFAATAGLLSLISPDPVEADPDPAAEFRTGKPRIAVLMPDLLMETEEQRARAEGMNSSVRNQLAKISGLEVVGGRLSVAKYQGSKESIRDIAEALDVDYVLEGMITFNGDQMFFEARLIEGQTETIERSWDFDSEYVLAEIFEIQREVARRVARAVSVEILPEENVRLERPVTQSQEALNHYTLGRHFWNQGTGEGFQRAIGEFERAIALDSGFAAAHAGLADAYNQFGTFFLRPPREMFAIARGHAARALEIDEYSAIAHASMGQALLYGSWDRDSAEVHLTRAIALDESYAEAHVWYGRLLTFEGDFENGLRELRRAVDLQPASDGVMTSLGYGEFFARRYEESLETLRLSERIDPSKAVTQVFLGQTLLELGRVDEAIEAIERAIERGGRLSPFLAMLGVAYARDGRLAEAEAVSRELQSSLEAGVYVPKWFIGGIELHLGRTEEALDWFDQAYEEGSYGLIYFNVSPHVDPVRDHPRFRSLLRGVGFAR
ncbi:MAG: protein kinase [Gemmatimonadota bacterium]|nr:protein kinase [Gemmatimonadota bacterium]